MNLSNEYQDRLVAGFHTVVLEIAEETGLSHVEVWEDGLELCEAGVRMQAHIDTEGL